MSDTKKKTKEKSPPPKPLTEEEIEEQGLELSSQSLEAQAQKVLSVQTIKSLKRIAYYVAKVGLPLDEACMLADINYSEFEEQMKLEPLIGKIIKIKTLEYKKDLLHTLSQQARGGDDKMASWLLEKRFPEEFGPKKRGGDGDGDGDSDVIFEAIKFIRKNGSNDPMVAPNAGDQKALGDGETEKIVADINDILEANTEVHEQA